MAAIVIMAGGPAERVPPVDLLRRKHQNAVWIGVDRGVYTLLQNGVTPKAAFGDFDSVTEEERQWIKDKAFPLEVYPEEKDETDLEIALNRALLEQPDHIYIYGATGGRLDHLFANVQLLFKGLKENVPVTLIDRQNRLELKGPGTYELQRREETYFSFIPISSKVEALSMTGFKYELDRHTLIQGTTLCVSNEIIKDTGMVTFEEGFLLFMETWDD
ncbi:thiamine diphosphokinase [Alteribacter keqinensis]|uniref:Thiamine diphosphokinase n=1 Tax=Alteribacter keqinensis TaxID=2483800 RepID=A0A3M7TVG5_9BACI|nr:thiamine diphosphokinase [Alteribacter keqinensis]RNA69640.1 thiamine diphosphokinase [Alteribacter keqinensis]